jgi:Spy/CpxP family protein refolding chaperone
MRHYIPTLGIIFSVALNLAFLGFYAYRTFAQSPGYAYEEAQLSPDQRARMVAGRDRFIETVNTIGNTIVGLQVQLIDAIAADPVDRSAIDASVDQIHAQQQAMQRTVVEHLIAEKSILTSDQRQAFFEVLKRRIRSQSAPRPPWMPRNGAAQ